MFVPNTLCLRNHKLTSLLCSLHIEFALLDSDYKVFKNNFPLVSSSVPQATINENLNKYVKTFFVDATLPVFLIQFLRLRCEKIRCKSRFFSKVFFKFRFIYFFNVYGQPFHNNKLCLIEILDQLLVVNNDYTFGLYQ